MRYLIALFLYCSCLAADAAPIGQGGARHLLERTGFGAPPELVVEFSRLERVQAVDRLLNGTFSALQSPPPDLVYERPGRLKDLSGDERRQAQQETARQGLDLRAWWTGEMLRAPTAQDALRERMTLFWHNHFVSSQQKVKSVALMQRQNALLRRYALGNFASLLHTVSKDPAMVIYLDNATNRKTSPNENFAREVMELFTLGEGHYSEQDVKEAARAFTGWSFAPESGEFVWRPAMHDFDEKWILGRRGNFDGDAVLDILLNQAATADFLAGKLWREFVSPTPVPDEQRRVAAALRSAAYEIRPALRVLLLSDSFWAPANRGSLIKSPVDFVIGTLRTLNVDVPDAVPVALALRNLGQDLFAPPNVRGWPGGESWINSTSLLARKQFIERLLRAGEMNSRPVLRQEMRETGTGPIGQEGKMRVVSAMAQMHFDAERWLARHPDNVAVNAALLAISPVQPINEGGNGLGLLRGLLLDPVYQLK